MLLLLLLSPGPAAFWPFTSFLPAALQEPRPFPCSCLARHLLWLCRLPSNLSTHILFKADSGPSEQLPSLATEVPSHLLIQVVWLGHSQASGSFHVAASRQALKSGKSCHRLRAWPLLSLYPRSSPSSIHFRSLGSGVHLGLCTSHSVCLEYSGCPQLLVQRDQTPVDV